MGISLLAMYGHIRLGLGAVKGKETAGLCRWEAFLQACLWWMLALFLATELLSAFHALELRSLAIFWGALALALSLSLWRRMVLGGYDWRTLLPVLPSGRGERLAAGGLAAIALFVIVLAHRTQPYNWDSITYRLARIAYWTQNASVEHYANNSLRLIANPPLGEFLLLHLYIFWGEALLCLPQSLAYAIGIWTVYGLAGRLGVGKGLSYLSALLFASLPIAFAEALNTQVDLVATLWLAAFVYSVLDLLERERLWRWEGLWLWRGISMGLAAAFGFLTKPSVCFAMAAFGLAVLILALRRSGGGVFLVKMAGAGLLGLWPICIEWARNIQSFGGIFAPMSGPRQLVGTLHPAYLLVNGVKNVVSNMTSIYLGEYNGLWGRLVAGLAWRLGVDMNHSAISEDGHAFRLHPAPDYIHDTAANPILLYALPAAAVLCLILWWRQRRRERLQVPVFVVCSLLSFAIFCLFARWNYYVSRYMLSFLLLLCPAVGWGLEQGSRLWGEGRRQAAKWAMVSAIAALAILDLANMARYHALLSARQQSRAWPYGYFLYREEEYAPSVELCRRVRERGFVRLGLFVGGNDYEYPYWALLKGQLERMEHVVADNVSAQYIDRTYVPEAILWIGPAPSADFVWNGARYVPAYAAGPERLLLERAE